MLQEVYGVFRIDEGFSLLIFFCLSVVWYFQLLPRLNASAQAAPFNVLELEILETESTRGGFQSVKTTYVWVLQSRFVCVHKPIPMWGLCNSNSFAAHTEATEGSGILLTERIYPVKNKSRNGYLFS